MLNIKKIIGLKELVIVSLLLLLSCAKNQSSALDCLQDEITVRNIVKAEATIIRTGELYYIIEQGTIDTRLLPCNLDPAYETDRLQVVISGMVKASAQIGPGPCCTENFVITFISKK
jgi:hypothetical protein